MRCFNCGLNTKRSHRFCPRCGKPMKKSSGGRKSDRRLKAMLLILIPVITFVILLIKTGYTNAIIGFVIALAIIFITLWLIRIGIIRILKQFKYKSKPIHTPNGKQPERKPVPSSIKKQVFARAHGRCERPRCSYGGKLHIHHIDGNHSNNSPTNLLAICPNCHSRIHDGSFSIDAQRSWIAE